MSLQQQVQQLILSNFPHDPTQGQLEACEALVDFLYDPDPNAAFLLKGYAGTGKTSLIGALIKTAPLIRIKTVLLAPTGRAAKVLANYSGKKTYTIHKKIYTTLTDSSGMMHVVRAQNKHRYTLFIVDEASMIGTGSTEEGDFGRRNLLEDLIEYVGEGYHCRLLFMGDTAQLPPVNATESPALDSNYLESISSLHLHEYELTEVVRQQLESGILRNATSLREKIAQLSDYDDIELPIFNLEHCPDLKRLPGEDLEEVLNQEYGQNDLESIAIVCRSNKRANLFNQSIRNRILFKEESINAGDYLMVVKNNYFWLDNESEIGFIANGDIIEILSARNFQELYGFHFADATIRFVDYPDAPTLDCKLLLETLYSESPSLTREESRKLFNTVMEDYADLPTKAERMMELQKNPYFNALQIKFSYALTCHKTQGGQWKTIVIDQGYLTDEMLNKEYLRWLYTALTRATEKVYLLGFEEKFFEEQQ